MGAQDKYSPTPDNFSHRNQTREYETQRWGLADSGKRHTTITVTTMASSIVRIHAAHRIPFPTCLSYSCRRRAMMSAWSSRSPPQPQTAANLRPPLHDSPPIVIPDAKAPLSPDAGSPQTAARPPPAPKMTRPKPTIRAQKVALTLVSNRRPNPRFFSILAISDYLFIFLLPV